MARGWESKSVEEQIQARESATQLKESREMTATQRDVVARREAIRLMRVRTTNFLENAASPGYRAMLQQTLLDLDAQLAEIDRT